MGCNCGKNSAQQPRRFTSPATPQPPPSASVAATQNLRAAAANARPQTFILLTTDGRTLAFGSRLEAEAARVRAKGGTIRPV